MGMPLLAIFGLVVLIAVVFYLFITPRILYDALVPEEQLTDSVILQIETPKGIINMKVNRWNAKTFQQYGPEAFPDFQRPQQSMYTRKVHVRMGRFGSYGALGRLNFIDFITLYELLFGDQGIYKDYEAFEEQWSKDGGSWETHEDDEILTDSKYPLWSLNPAWRDSKREQ